MSDDARWCGAKDEDATLYTFLPINHKHDGVSVNCMQNLRRHRNRINRNRDISCVSKTTTKSSDEASTSSTLKFSRSYQLINLCLVIALHMICCNEFVTSVNCDELLDSVEARVITNTWAVHIPGGLEVAQQVAAEHGMEMRGKVSALFFLQIII